MVSDAGRALCERIAGELRDLAASLDYSAAGHVKEIADALDPEGDRSAPTGPGRGCTSAGPSGPPASAPCPSTGSAAAVAERPPALDDLLDHLAATMPPLALDEIDQLQEHVIRMSRRHGQVDEAVVARWRAGQLLFAALARLLHGWGDLEVARWREGLAVPVVPYIDREPRRG
jgi:hypothetical protein